MNGIKTTLLLGAGATRGAIKGFNVGGSRLQAPLNGDFIRVAKSFVKTPEHKALKLKLKRLLDFVHEEIGLPKSKKPPTTMEEIFSMAYTSKDFLDVYKRTRGRKPSSLKEISDFLILLTSIFRSIDTYVSKQPNRFNLYKELAGLLENGDTVITLNYDTLIDRELLLRGWNPTCGYGANLSHTLKGYRKKRFTEEQPLKNVKLLKLHGSFNWFTRKNKTDALDMIFKKKPSLVFSPDSVRWNEKKRYVRQIIPPVYGKFFSHDFWRDLWTWAFQEVVTSKRLIVIGCSLIETDFHLRAFLGRVKVTKKQKSTPFKEVIIVDPNKEGLPQKRFEAILRGCKKRFRSMNSFEALIKFEKRQRRQNG